MKGFNCYCLSAVDETSDPMPLDKVIKSEFLLFNFSCAQRGIESKGLGDNETES